MIAFLPAWMSTREGGARRRLQLQHPSDGCQGSVLGLGGEIDNNPQKHQTLLVNWGKAHFLYSPSLNSGRLSYCCVNPAMAQRTLAELDFFLESHGSFISFPLFDYNWFSCLICLFCFFHKHSFLYFSWFLWESVFLPPSPGLSKKSRERKLIKCLVLGLSRS